MNYQGLMEITKIENIADDVYEMTLKGEGAKYISQPGQFINIKINESLQPYLRRPMSISDYDENTIVRAFDEGAEDYIVKPFEMLELLVRIEKVLERNGKNEHLICIYDVEIDTEKHTVKKAGQEVYLKPMEYECLLMFVRHKNKALTRGQILGALWGMEFEGETRTVDAHVGRIRKKLDWGNVIKTIPTIGYRLEVDQ